jgi:hypothetical protein
MIHIVEIPAEAGGHMLVQVADEDLPEGLQLAAPKPGEIVTRLRKPVEQALDEIKPAVQATIDHLRAMSPDAIKVEFGIILGLEAGAVLAKGSTEASFKVTMSWQPSSTEQPLSANNDSVPRLTPRSEILTSQFPKREKW